LTRAREVCKELGGDDADGDHFAQLLEQWKDPIGRALDAVAADDPGEDPFRTDAEVRRLRDRYDALLDRIQAELALYPEAVLPTGPANTVQQLLNELWSVAGFISTRLLELKTQLSVTLQKHFEQDAKERMEAIAMRLRESSLARVPEEPPGRPPVGSKRRRPPDLTGVPSSSSPHDRTEAAFSAVCARLRKPPPRPEDLYEVTKEFARLANNLILEAMKTYEEQGGDDPERTLNEILETFR
jgi:hypothetical protein